MIHYIYIGRKYFVWLFLSALLLVLSTGSLRTLAAVLLKAKTKNLLTPSKDCYYLDFLALFLFDTHSKNMGFLNPFFNTFNSFTLPLLDKVTIGTYNFVFVILNVVSTIVDITQSFIQFNSRWILQLINGISNNLQMLLKYFSVAAIFTFLNAPLSVVVSGLKSLICI